MALKAGRPGRSEMSFGKGRFPDPRSDYQSQRNLVFPQGEDKRDVNLRRQKELALDATNPVEVFDDMAYVAGNPDTGYVRPPLVQEKPVFPPAVYKAPVWRYGVERGE
jgi:hypothetical protein